MASLWFRYEAPSLTGSIGIVELRHRWTPDTLRSLLIGVHTPMVQVMFTGSMHSKIDQQIQNSWLKNSKLGPALGVQLQIRLHIFQATPGAKHLAGRPENLTRLIWVRGSLLWFGHSPYQSYSVIFIYWTSRKMLILHILPMFIEPLCCMNLGEWNLFTPEFAGNLSQFLHPEFHATNTARDRQRRMFS